MLRFQLQFGQAWRLDVGSLAIGLAAGIVLTFLLQRLFRWLGRRQRRAAGWLRRSVAWMRSGVEVRFQAETVEHVQRYHLGRAWATLDQVFQPPRLLVHPPEIDATPPADWGASQLNYLWPELAARIATPRPLSIGVRELLLGGGRTLVSAAAGTGKTTLLAYLAHRCASAAADGPDAQLFPLIPVFIHLSELGLGASGGSKTEAPRELADPLEFLASALQRRSSPITSPGIKGMLQKKMRAGQVLLLLDGWDEAPAGPRETATQWLGQLLAIFPKIPVVAAAPLVGYGPLLELDFAFSGLLPWRAGMVESFAAKWTKAYPLSQPPHRRYYWQPGQIALETCLRFWLMVASQNADGSDISRPRRWAQLVEKSAVLFTTPEDNHPHGEPDSAYSMPDWLTLAFWRRLAYALVSEEKLSLSQSDVSRIIEELPANHEELEREDATRLQKSISRSGLFITWANGSVSFMCPIWRDHLAAAFAVEKSLHEAVVQHVSDPHWSDVIAFYVAQKGATELATQLLGRKEQSLTRDALFQVASWMGEATDGGEWRRQTMILLGQIIRQVTFAHALRQRAVIALVQTSEPGVFTFVSQLLERSDPFLRHLGTAALSHLGSEKAIGMLAKMLEDGDRQVRNTAVYALGWIQHPLTEKPLLTALIQGDEEMSRIAAEGLALSGSDGVEILREAMEDDDAQVRRAAIQGLALLDDEWIVRTLVEVERNDREWVVKAAATEALQLIRSRHKPPAWKSVPVGKQQWLLRHAAQEGRSVPKGDATLPYLVQIMTEYAGAKQRAAAATSLGQIAAWDALPALETAVRDGNKQVSEAAFTTLCLLRRAFARSPVEEPAP